MNVDSDVRADSAVAGPSSALLCAEAVQRHHGPVTALRPTTLRLRDGDHVAVVGRSGAGKSTLLHLLAGMDRPSNGRVVFRDRDLTAATDEELAEVRRRDFGFVFQSGRLIPYLSAAENVALPLMLNGIRRRAALSRAGELLFRLGIGDLASRRPLTLSGGEAQRVAIARAVAHDPDVVFADEPTGNLDSASADAALDLLLGSTEGRTLLLVTHDTELAGRFPRRIELCDGTIVSDRSRRHEA